MINRLTVENIIKFNAYVIGTLSPKETIAIKDVSALQMSVAQPNQVVQVVFDEELYKIIYEKAAILFINIATKYCFHNGNKRTAWLSLVVFFDINGYDTSFPREEGVKFTLDVVNSNSKGESFDNLKSRVSEYLRNSLYINQR